MASEREASILIVDDNVSLCITMSLILRHKGYTVATTNDGPEAIRTVRERPFDMVFMDIKMPVMNGVEAFRRVKEIRPDAVVMMMTAYAVEDLVRQALEEGAYGIVYKPLVVEEMLRLVEEVQERKPGVKGEITDSASCFTP